MHPHRLKSQSLPLILRLNEKKTTGKLRWKDTRRGTSPMNIWKRWDTLLFHGSCISVDSKAYLFTAKSGTGKSTHTQLWKKWFGERAVFINDDKPLLKISAQGVTVYGTPWDGKHHRSTNTSCPLKAVCILTRNTENSIQRIDKKAALPMLCQQSYRPCSPIGTQKTLALVDRLGSSVPLYRLGCNMEPEAALVAYHGMNYE